MNYFKILNLMQFSNPIFAKFVQYRNYNYLKYFSIKIKRIFYVFFFFLSLLWILCSILKTTGVKYNGAQIYSIFIVFISGIIFQEKGLSTIFRGIKIELCRFLLNLIICYIWCQFRYLSKKKIALLKVVKKQYDVQRVKLIIHRQF